MALGALVVKVENNKNNQVSAGKTYSFINAAVNLINTSLEYFMNCELYSLSFLSFKN